MLDFSLRSTDLPIPWQAVSNGWAAGESRIEPFRHVALEDYAVKTDKTYLFVVRERLVGASAPCGANGRGEILRLEPTEWEATLASVLAWPLQFVAFIIQTVQTGPSVTIVSGRWGNGPIFVIGRPREFMGSWDPARLYPHLQSQPLDTHLAAHFLASFDAPYSRKTLFSEMSCLTERSRACWQSGKSGHMELKIEYPPAVLQIHPDKLKPDADVLGTFYKILKSSMSRWLPPGTHCAGVELSGGLDSAIVAIAAAELVDCPLATYGVILLDEMGNAQRARRLELVQSFGFSDETLDISDYIPLAPNSKSMMRTPVVPWEDVYFEALDTLLANAAHKGTRIMFTGLGGDELCGLSLYDFPELNISQDQNGEATPCPYDEHMPSFLTESARQIVRETRNRLDRAAHSLICSSSLSAAACSSAMGMRHGLWSVSPLCTPELVGFCARLPLEWRQERAIERKLLSKFGCSRNVAYPPAPDDFSPACRLGVRTAARPTFERLFQESRLADLGLVDRDRLLTSYRTWCAGNDIDGDLPFYSVAILEQTLRALEPS